MNRYQLIGQPMDGSRPGITWPLLKKNGVTRSPLHLFRAGYVLTANALMGSALAKWEQHRFTKTIAETEMAAPPVFIIGHWRSGTTLLHNLMSLDGQFGYLRNSQALLPFATFLRSGVVRKLVDFHLMPKRPMDDVSLSPEGPQEEEFVLGSQFGEGAYLGWYFPEKFADYFERYGLLEGMSNEERQAFAAHYLSVVKKISLANGNKPLLLKNPVNTGRVRMLLELFPNAKFIYLRRDCTEVYHSTLRLHTKLIESFSFQKHIPEDLGSFVIRFYRRMIQQYESDKLLIPPGQLIETDYESLTQRPVETLGHIYGSLGLPGFDEAKPAFTQYMDDQKKNYRPATYRISQQEVSALKLAMA